MPGLFKKLFRRKNASAAAAEEGKPKKKDKRSVGKREKSKAGGSRVEAAKNQLSEPGAPKDEEEALQSQPSVSGTTTSGKASTASRDTVEHAKKSETPPGARVFSPRNQKSPRPTRSTVESSRMETSARRGPVDLDDTDFEESDLDETRDRSSRSLSEPPAGLSFQQLQQFNLQQQSQPPQQRTHQQLYVMADSPPATTQMNRLPDGQLKAMDDMLDQSEGSTSDFNLSTDAEDEEYNALKRRVAATTAVTTPIEQSMLDTSMMSSPTNYTTDEDRAIFPALNTDDDETSTEPPPHILHPTPDDEPGPIKITPMAHETEDDMRAWGISPSMSSGKENGSMTNESALFSTKSTPKSDATSRKSFTSPTNHGFADFANFDSAFPDPALSSPSQPKKRSVGASRSFLIEDPTMIRHSSDSRRTSSGAVSAADPDTSLSELLAQAKKATSSGSSRRHRTSSSVNSAPAITAQYLRQYHGLRSQSSGGADSRSAAEKSTSVSDIIQSLEATNASRLKNSSSRSRSHRSVGSRESANASVRSAKERIRERRRREREGSSSSRRNRSRSSASEVGSDHSSDNDVSENWLFDEVTGALGPRGIAADMESLSGRSNRSKNSTGNKSHRSHRSHRSHKSASRRRKKSSSNESVDSKNSRNSRYSHRSTKSYLSQMSEQSRSVANDLLRLEMQLAMVGSQENGDEGHGRSGGSVGGSIGGTSKTSRTSRSSSATRRATAIARRTKITVVAPPGKLGIILANKADSKGTVVSGVRTSSVLADKISPGDRIVAIDGEDVSRMTVSEITTIMARKSEFERTLTVLSTPKVARSTSSTRDYGKEPEGSYSSYRR